MKWFGADKISFNPCIYIILLHCSGYYDDNLNKIKVKIEKRYKKDVKKGIFSAP